jgi:hypothetical protein
MLNYIFGSKDQQKEQKPESEDPEVALKDQLDSHGAFNQDEGGIIKFEHLMYLRSVIIR